MTIVKTGEAYVGEYDCGKQAGYGYCSRNIEEYKVQEQCIATQYKWIDEYVTSAMYEGELFDNQLNGYGVLITQQDEMYEGHWHNGLMQGKGKFTDYYGSSYDGLWELNKRNGYGVSIELNGDKEPCDNNNGTYEGQWYDNDK